LLSWFTSIVRLERRLRRSAFIGERVGRLARFAGLVIGSAKSRLRRCAPLSSCSGELQSCCWPLAFQSRRPLRKNPPPLRPILWGSAKQQRNRWWPTHYGRDGKQDGVGAGFIVSGDGLIATCFHVIDEARPHH
jgi:S1-C subfamily serine protease